MNRHQMGKEQGELSLKQTVEVVVYTLARLLADFPGHMQDSRSLQTILDVFNEMRSNRCIEPHRRGKVHHSICW